MEEQSQNAEIEGLKRKIKKQWQHFDPQKKAGNQLLKEWTKNKQGEMKGAADRGKKKSLKTNLSGMKAGGQKRREC